MSGPGGTDVPFGRLLGSMTIGPAVGIVVFFVFIAQWTNIFGWCWIQFACCLVVSGWSWKKTTLVRGEGARGAGTVLKSPGAKFMLIPCAVANVYPLLPHRSSYQAGSNQMSNFEGEADRAPLLPPKSV